MLFRVFFFCTQSMRGLRMNKLLTHGSWFNAEHVSSHTWCTRISISYESRRRHDHILIIFLIAKLEQHDSFILFIVVGWFRSVGLRFRFSTWFSWYDLIRYYYRWVALRMFSCVFVCFLEVLLRSDPSGERSWRVIFWHVWCANWCYSFWTAYWLLYWLLVSDCWLTEIEIVMLELIQ